MTTAEVAGTDGYAAFRYRNFTLHCAARFIMGIGLSMQVVAIGWYIYDVTNSALALGLSGLATFLPPAIFALFTGHVADTYSRRLIVTTAFSVYAICSLGLLLLVLNKSSQVWLIYGLIFIGSTGRAFSNPASQALTPNTVPKELFANAVTFDHPQRMRWARAAALAGLPVLAAKADGSHTTGVAVLSMPTLGYVVGFMLAAAMLGYLAEHGYSRTALRTVVAMVVGNIIIYTFGLLWLKASLAGSWSDTIAWGLTPFLVGDAFKLLLAAGLLPAAWKLARG